MSVPVFLLPACTPEPVDPPTVPASDRSSDLEEEKSPEDSSTERISFRRAGVGMGS
jgi:hypothetical protein